MSEKSHAVLYSRVRFVTITRLRKPFLSLPVVTSYFVFRGASTGYHGATVLPPLQERKAYWKDSLDPYAMNNLDKKM